MSPDKTRSEYESEVFYEAWRRGIDPDRAVRCADDCYYDRRSAEECVDGTARQIRAEREKRQQAEAEELALYEKQQRAYWEEQERLAAEADERAAP